MLDMHSPTPRASTAVAACGDFAMHMSPHPCCTATCTAWHAWLYPYMCEPQLFPTLPSPPHLLASCVTIMISATSSVDLPLPKGPCTRQMGGISARGPAPCGTPPTPPPPLCAAAAATSPPPPPPLPPPLVPLPSPPQVLVPSASACTCGAWYPVATMPPYESLGVRLLLLPPLLPRNQEAACHITAAWQKRGAQARQCSCEVGWAECKARCGSLLVDYYSPPPNLLKHSTEILEVAPPSPHPPTQVVQPLCSPGLG